MANSSVTVTSTSHVTRSISTTDLASLDAAGVSNSTVNVVVNDGTATVATTQDGQSKTATVSAADALQLSSATTAADNVQSVTVDVVNGVANVSFNDVDMSALLTDSMAATVQSDGTAADASVTVSDTTDVVGLVLTVDACDEAVTLDHIVIDSSINAVQENTTNVTQTDDQL